MLEFFTILADQITYHTLSLTAGTHLAEAVHFFIEDTTKIFFLLTVLMMIVGFFRSWISPEKVRIWLDGKPKIIAYIMAVLLGAVTPFCSCSSIPLFIAFLSSGIPLGVTMAFLITSPMVNEVAAVLFGEAIGWKFTIAYLGVGMITGIIGGALILSQRRLLAALSLGEPVAESMGFSVKKGSRITVLGAACLVGSSVPVAGAIGFVGLLVPHMLRPFVGHRPDKLLIPAALLGAILVCLADIAVRGMPLGRELKLGVLTSLIGAPFFVCLVWKERKRWL